MNKPFKITKLKNNIVVEFFDHTNRYYGDFHRVKISVVATIPFSMEAIPADLRQLAATYAGSVSYEKDIEQMGVATEKVASVSDSLIDNFISTVGSYLEKENFVAGLLRKEMSAKTSVPEDRY